MRPIIKAAALAVFVCAATLAAASGAETAPAGDPGQEIKDGAVAFGHGVRDGSVKFGHGVRDGAVRAWGAVKSAVGSDGKTADKHKRPPPKDSGKEPK
jgi:hypothetical protein